MRSAMAAAAPSAARLRPVATMASRRAPAALTKRGAHCAAAARRPPTPSPVAADGRGRRRSRRPPAPPRASSPAAAAPQNPSPPLPLRVVLPTAAALLVCNMDRICLSVAILPMSLELGWPPSFQGVVQSAFLLGYAATQLLGGALADRYGGRRVLAAGIAWFSLASAALPLALSPAVAAAGLTVPAVLAARCAVGLGEGVALPAMNSLIASRVAPGRRATALGVCFGGFHAGNLVGLVLSPALMGAFGWRALFYAFGMLGAPLLAMWLAVVPEDGGRVGAAARRRAAAEARAAPADDADDAAKAAAAAAAAASTTSPSAPTDEDDDARPPPTVRQLLSSRHTWAIVAVNFVNHWGYFIYLNWMPTYFSRTLGLGFAASSALSFLPWLAMAVGSSVAGVLADGLVARGADGGWTVTRVRKVMQATAFLVPALALGVLSRPEALSPPLAVGALVVALGATSLGQAGFVANMTDIAPTAGGRLFGLSNTFGCAAGVLGVTTVGVVVERVGSFAPIFAATAAMYVLATGVWLAWCTGERVF